MEAGRSRDKVHPRATRWHFSAENEIQIVLVSGDEAKPSNPQFLLVDSDID